MKINYRDMYELFRACANVDNEKTIKLGIKAKVALALNMKEMKEFVITYEKLTADKKIEARTKTSDPVLIEQMVEVGMRETAELEEELNLRMIEVKDLELSKNNIPVMNLMAMASIITDLETLL